MKGIATALAKAQAEMGKALKQSNNPHFKTKYADLGNVMDACLPALNAAGIAVIQPTGEDEHGRYVETILIHGESGESLACRVPLIVSKNDMQGYGSAVTYGRRYGLMAMAGIAPEDDDGNAAAAAAPKAPKEQPKAPPHPTVVDIAKQSLLNAASLDQLKAIFTGLPPDVRALDAVIDAKDVRKSELTDAAAASALPNPDLDNDQIPY
jgi:hypothetical protein